MFESILNPNEFDYVSDESWDKLYSWINIIEEKRSHIISLSKKDINKFYKTEGYQFLSEYKKDDWNWRFIQKNILIIWEDDKYQYIVGQKIIVYQDSLVVVIYIVMNKNMSIQIMSNIFDINNYIDLNDLKDLYNQNSLYAYKVKATNLLEKQLVNIDIIDNNFQFNEKLKTILVSSFKNPSLTDESKWYEEMVKNFKLAFKNIDIMNSENIIIIK